MVYVYPKPQRGKYPVVLINDSIAVAPVLWLVKLRQGEKTVGLRGWGLVRYIAKEFFSTVNYTVAIAVQAQECVSRIFGRPGDLDKVTRSRNIKLNTILRVRQFEALATHVNNDRATVRRVASITRRERSSSSAAQTRIPSWPSTALRFNRECSGDNHRQA